MVVANLLLDPHEVYVVPETTIPLRLLQVKHGRIHGKLSFLCYFMIIYVQRLFIKFAILSFICDCRDKAAV